MISAIVSTIGRLTVTNTVLSLIGQKHLGEIIISLEKGNYLNVKDLIEEKIQDTRIKYIINSKPGLYNSLNQAISEAQFPYISFVHDDDWIQKDFYEVGMKAIEQYKEIPFVYGDVVMHSKGGEVTYLEASSYYLKNLNLTTAKFFHPSAIYKADLFQKYGNFETRIGKKNIKIAADYGWILKTSNFGIKGLKVNGMIYHMLDGGISRDKSKEALKESLLFAIKYSKNTEGLINAWFTNENHHELLDKNILGKLFIFQKKIKLNRILPRKLFKFIKFKILKMG